MVVLTSVAPVQKAQVRPDAVNEVQSLSGLPCVCTPTNGLILLASAELVSVFIRFIRPNFKLRIVDLF